jgi:hypothetical protein
MTFDSGPVVGEMLNAHFFPAVNWYNGGTYSLAASDFTYCIRRAEYLNGNPRQAEFVSMAYYLRGMIYFYHAKGVGSKALAKADFEQAIKWNGRNYTAYIELSRLYAELGFSAQATSVLERLLELKPGEEIFKEAQTELSKLKSKGAN